MQQHNSRPETRTERVINRLFERLNLAYGRDFNFKFEGLDMTLVKGAWAVELDVGSEKKEEAIRWALENLPVKMPNPMEFKRLMQQAPVYRDPAVKFLPEPAVDQAVLVKVMAQVATIKHQPSCEPKAWARRIIERHAAGERIGNYQLQSAREALRIGASA
jgi:hypothetical protein